MVAVDAGPSLHVSIHPFRCPLSGDLSHCPRMSLREFQFFRMHKARLNECSGFPSAFASVLRFHEAAIVAEVLIQITTRPRQNLTEVDRGHLCDLRANVVAHPEDL